MLDILFAFVFGIAAIVSYYLPIGFLNTREKKLIAAATSGSVSVVLFIKYLFFGAKQSTESGPTLPAAAGVAVTSPTPAPTNALQPTVPPVEILPITQPAVPTPTSISNDKIVIGRYVRLGFTEGQTQNLNLAEIEVFDENNNKIAITDVTSSSQYGNYGPKNLADGNTGNFAHTDNKANEYYELDLNTEKKISKIVVHNRKDCCKERAIGAMLLIKDGSNKVVLTTGKITKAASRYIYNPPTSGSSPNSE